MKDLKKQIEAILFSVGKYILLEEIATLCKKDPQHIKEALLELTVDYEQNDSSSLVVLNEGDMWKLTTREEYGTIVRNIVSETELTKSQMETLAIIAFKYPIKQSDLIRIRTNKAYDHLMELEKSGFISRQKYGRTRLIKLTDKFFEYFDLPRGNLKARFNGFEQLANTIEKKEGEIENIKEGQKKASEEAGRQKEKERKTINSEIDLIDDKGKEHKLEIIDEPKEILEIKEIEDTLGDLEVIDEIEEKETMIAPKKENEEEELKSVDEVLGLPKKKENEKIEENHYETKKELEKNEIKEERKDIEKESNDKEKLKSIDEVLGIQEEENEKDIEKDKETKEKEEGIDLLEAKKNAEQQDNK